MSFLSGYESIQDVQTKSEEKLFQYPTEMNRTSIIDSEDSANCYYESSDLDSELDVSESTRDRRITGFDAISALVKGNLGPGCLNLPYAFVLTGWAVGSFLFLVVAAQGIYSMWLLLYCKELLMDHGKKGKTFMDIAKLSTGRNGQRGVQFFLFVQQTGVCCVFMSLVITNLEGALKTSGYIQISNTVCTGLVMLVLLCIVPLRFVKDLRWLSGIANAFMIFAIFTAAIAGLNEIVRNSDELLPPNASTSSIINIANFVSAMFFAFEGIGLVMPIENSFCVGYSNPLQLKQACRKFRYWLVFAMSIVASLFVFIGLSASIGFPNIEVGSISDYLVRRYPSNGCYQTANALIIAAVLFTFPLQLTPAVEVLDEWCNSKRHLENNSIDETMIETDMNVLKTIVPPNQEERLDDTHDTHYETLTSHSSFWNLYGKYEWLLRRWLLVLGCTLVVSIVSDLSALISLFGAFGQTGLAAMPCFIHYSMQKQGIAPKHIVLSIIDVVIISFCGIVMVSGFIFSMQNIITLE